MNIRKIISISLLASAVIYAHVALSICLTLRDALQRVSTEFPIVPSLSADGSRAYTVYEINVAPGTTLSAEIFNNNNGNLSSVSALNGNLLSPFTSVDDGHANPDFTLFSFLDDTSLQSSGNNLVRLRTFDQNFNVQQTRTFTDLDNGSSSSPNFSVAGGEFSDDGSLIVFSYMTNSSSTPQVSILRVLRTSDLSEVAHINFNGGSSGPIFFTTCDDNKKRTFIALTAYDNFSFQFLNPAAQPPSTLFVYELKNNSLKLVDFVTNLPQQSGSPTASVKGDKVLIGVGTTQALLPGEISLLTPPTAAFPNTDGKELRIYTFNGHKLHLAFAQDTGLSTSAPIFYPRGHFVLVNEQAVDGEPGFFNFFETRLKHDKVKLDLENGTYLSVPFFLADFSVNGKWLLVTGSDQDTAILNNIALYQVNS